MAQNGWNKLINRCSNRIQGWNHNIETEEANAVLAVNNQLTQTQIQLNAANTQIQIHVNNATQLTTQVNTLNASLQTARQQLNNEKSAVR